jgi:hypothetical protein
VGSARVDDGDQRQPVGEQSNDGDTTYVYDSTVGHEDLYDLTDLATTPTTILAVQSRMSAKKSDTRATGRSG